MLLEKRAEMRKEADELAALAETTSEEDERIAALGPELRGVNDQIAAEEVLREELRRGPAVAAEPLQAANGTEAQADALPTPFRSLGEQLASVARAAQNPHATDQRLLDIQAAAAGASEGVASDGGFLVQTDFTGELLRLVHETGVLVRRVNHKPISANANGVKVNAVDESSRADGSRQGGVQAYWTGEAGSLIASKPKYRQMELNLQKLIGLYYATDELLMDTVALGAFAEEAFTEEFGFKIDDAIIRGTGAGMPLGILGHAGTVSVSKEGGQTAATIRKENVEKMFARMLTRSLMNSEWFINQSCWPQLFQLSQAVGVGGVPVFIPPGGMSAAPFGTLLGRPVTPIEQCSALGTVGDIIFADFGAYQMIDKGGIEAASSIHVQFLTDETVFRFILRTDGQPKRNAVLTPFKGSDTISSFLTLATRALGGTLEE
jgi:HK97 family phage major capsid protein